MHKLIVHNDVRLRTGKTISPRFLGAIPELLTPSDGVWRATLVRHLWGVPVAFKGPLPTVVWPAHGAEPPDFNSIYILHVSEAVRTLIERFEPGVHQFERVSFVDGSNRPLPDRYLLFVSRLIDMVDPSSSGMIRDGRFWRPVGDIARRPVEEWPDGLDPKARTKLRYNHEACAGHHLWQPNDLVTSQLFVSDELAGAMAAESLTGVSFVPVEEQE
jgi:hypothetical protein